MRFAAPLLAVAEVILRRRRLDVIFFLDAFGIAVAVGEVDDAHRAAGGLDALHQSAGAQHFVVGMRRDHEQTRCRRHVELERRRRRRLRDPGLPTRRRASARRRDSRMVAAARVIAAAARRWLPFMNVVLDRLFWSEIR